MTEEQLDKLESVFNAIKEKGEGCVLEYIVLTEPRLNVYEEIMSATRMYRNILLVKVRRKADREWEEIRICAQDYPDIAIIRVWELDVDCNGGTVVFENEAIKSD